MSHEVESMFYVNETPWHGLGVELDNPPTIKEAIVAAGLDWKVITKPLYHRTDPLDRTLIQADSLKKINRSAVLRETDSSLLGVVGHKWTPLQNIEAFDFFQPFLDAEEVTLETAGSLRHGKHVWVLAKMIGDPDVIVGDDVVHRFLLLANGHDGTMAVTAAITPIRAVCANTLAAALEDDNTKMLRVIHTDKVKDGLELVKKAVDVAGQQFAANAELYRALTRHNINSQDLELYVKRVFIGPKKMRQLDKQIKETGIASNIGARILDDIIPLFEKGMGNDLPGVRGTWWAAYNSVSEYLAHLRGNSNDRRLDSLWFGASAVKNRLALHTAKAMALV